MIEDAHNFVRSRPGATIRDGIGANWGLGTVFLQPREAARLADRAGFTDLFDIATLVAVGGAESQWGVRAWHDNLDGDGNVLSRDVGWLQINIPLAAIGTSRETDLYDPEFNVGVARKLFLTPTANGIRGFQPWVAWNSGVYLHDHYAGKAALGVCNLIVERLNQAGATLPLPLFTTHDLAAKLG